MKTYGWENSKFRFKSMSNHVKNDVHLGTYCVAGRTDLNVDSSQSWYFKELKS